MKDLHHREINYLRISVTDHCNLHCRYCRSERKKTLPTATLLTYEDITAICTEAQKIGFNKVRITGGEPLIRKNIEILIQKISDIDGIHELAITTNGTHLTGKAALLKEMGLSSINISLDTLDPEEYYTVTGYNKLSDVITGIKAATYVGLAVKINMVVFNETREENIIKMQEFCAQHNITLQTIAHYSLEQRNNNHNCHRPLPCAECNKIRLLSDGTIKPCLFSEEEMMIDMQNIKGSLKKAICVKPLKGHQCSNRSITQIGG